jgi:serine/threonine protein kinase
MKIKISPTAEDATDASVSACINIRRTSHEGLILAFEDVETMEEWLNACRFAGSIMRDLDEQVNITSNVAKCRLVESKPSGILKEKQLLTLHASTKPEKMKLLLNDAYFLLNLQHPGIPRSLGIYDLKIQGQHGWGVLSDFKAGSDLLSWIPPPGFPEYVIKGIVVQVRDVLMYLHKRLIVHRDIKPENVHMMKGEDGLVKIVVANFNFAAHGEDQSAMERRCGTPGCLAPEVFQKKPENSTRLPSSEVLKIDVFSFGVLMYRMALFVLPFFCGGF